MNILDFFDYHNRYCEFTLNDGQIITGVIFQFSHDERPSKYYLVRTNKMREYKNAEEIGDKKRCQELSEEFDLSNISSAKKLQ